jgi:hypothetical protein
VGRPAGVPRVAWALLALGALIAPWVRRSRFAAPGFVWEATAVWTLAALVAALTPDVRFAGGARTTLPHAALLQALGLYEVIRQPGRLGVAALVGLALLTGLAFAAVAALLPGERRGRVVPLVRAAAAGCVVAALYAAYVGAVPRLPSAYPTQNAIAPAPLLQAALAVHPGPVLEVPVGPGIIPHARAMYRAIHHRQPILNGYNGYWPRGFPERMQLACRLPDTDALRTLVRETGLATIIVHVGVWGTPPSKTSPSPYACGWEPERWRPEVGRRRATGDVFRLIAVDGQSYVFAVNLPRS